jgi:mannose-1-phosphate guanylyltransferase
MSTPDLSTNAIVLAGGRGTRLQHLTAALGEPLEKQFCCLGGDRSLLQRSVERLTWLESLSRVGVVIREDQLGIAAEQLDRYRAASLITQPADRGTGVAVLTALLREVFRQPSVTVLSPCDHGFADESVLDGVLSRAIALAAEIEAPILIGAGADRARSDYGWIVPERNGGRQHSHVAGFVEKPEPERAAELLRRGGMFNTMLMVAPTATLLSAFELQAPETFNTLLPAAFMKGHERELFLRWAFSEIEPLDFSRDVVANTPGLRVMCLPAEAGWTDLGDETRLVEWLERTGSAAIARVKRARLLVSERLPARRATMSRPAPWRSENTQNVS